MPTCSGAELRGTMGAVPSRPIVCGCRAPPARRCRGGGRRCAVPVGRPGHRPGGRARPGREDPRPAGGRRAARRRRATTSSSSTCARSTGRRPTGVGRPHGPALPARAHRRAARRGHAGPGVLRLVRAGLPAEPADHRRDRGQGRRAPPRRRTTGRAPRSGWPTGCAAAGPRRPAGVGSGSAAWSSAAWRWSGSVVICWCGGGVGPREAPGRGPGAGVGRVRRRQHRRPRLPRQPGAPRRRRRRAPLRGGAVGGAGALRRRRRGGVRRGARGGARRDAARVHAAPAARRRHPRGRADQAPHAGRDHHGVPVGRRAPRRAGGGVRPAPQPGGDGAGVPRGPGHAAGRDERAACPSRRPGGRRCRSSTRPDPGSPPRATSTRPAASSPAPPRSWPRPAKPSPPRPPRLPPIPRRPGSAAADTAGPGPSRRRGQRRISHSARVHRRVRRRRPR